MTRQPPTGNSRNAQQFEQPQASQNAAGARHRTVLTRPKRLALRLPWGVLWTLPLSLLLLILTLTPEAFPGAHPVSAVTLFLTAPGLMIIPVGSVRERAVYWTLVIGVSVTVNFSGALLLLYVGGFTRPKLLLSTLLLTLLLGVLARTRRDTGNDVRRPGRRRS